VLKEIHLPLEIERKFLVAKASWRTHAKHSRYISDHLVARFSSGKARIRICDNASTLTFKGLRQGLSRQEFHIPLEDEHAAGMIAEFATTPALEKQRHEVEVNGVTWQIDEFAGALHGLVTADVELPSETYNLTLPDWAGEEITGNRLFSSSTLALALQEQGDLVPEILDRTRQSA
jgi:CYTH domain-containing protein